VRSALAAVMMLAVVGGCAPAPARPTATSPERALVGLWVPSPPEVIGAMLALADVRSTDVVYDLGSGEGEIVIEAARRAGARAVGVELDHERIENAARNAAAAGVADRVRFEVAGAADYPGAGYGLVCIFDALHDMGNPVGAAAHIRRSLAPDGTFLLVEPMAGERLEDNIGIAGRMFYSAAPIVCRPHARSEQGPCELGNQVPDSRWRELLAEAGFRRFRRATETPFNRVFEVRH